MVSHKLPFRKFGRVIGRKKFQQKKKEKKNRMFLGSNRKSIPMLLNDYPKGSRNQVFEKIETMLKNENLHPIKYYSEKRLMMDLKEIKEQNDPFIAAFPLSKNLFEWHVNIKSPVDGKLKGLVAHMIFSYPFNYPDSPPKVRLMTSIPHYHVFGSGFCIDLLQTHHSFERHYGWTSAYTTYSICKQLQSFLFSEDGRDGIQMDRIEDVDKFVEKTNAHVCYCGHNKNKQFWPAFNVFANTERKRPSTKQLPLICFHTKKSSDEAILGIGFKVNKSKSNGRMTSVISVLDVISHEAYKTLGVRKGVWNEEFVYFMPLFVDEKKWGNGAFEIFRDIIIKFYNLKNYTTSYGVTFVTKLLNSMIVIMMKGKVHASLKAIEAYLSFLHLLDYLLKKAPSLRKQIDEKVHNFCRNKNCRSKSQIPDFGEFFPLMTFSRAKWNTLGNLVVDEIFDRNAFWIDKHDKLLLNVKTLVYTPFGILKKVFPIVNVSLKVVMFNYMFFITYRTFGNRVFAENNEIVIEALQDKFFKIQKVDNWEDFFYFIGMDYIGSKTLVKKLRDAEVSARKRGYFTKDNTKKPMNMLNKKKRKRDWGSEENAKKKVKRE